jgi:hypothetical protein
LDFFRKIYPAEPHDGQKIREKYYEKKATGSDDVPMSTKRMKVTENEEPVTSTQSSPQGDPSVYKDTEDYHREQKVMSLEDTQKSEKSLELSEKSIESSKTSSNVENGKPVNFLFHYYKN